MAFNMESIALRVVHLLLIPCGKTGLPLVRLLMSPAVGRGSWVIGLFLADIK